MTDKILNRKENIMSQIKQDSAFFIKMSPLQTKLIFHALKEHLETDNEQCVLTEVMHIELQDLVETFNPVNFHLESGGTINDLTS